MKSKSTEPTAPAWLKGATGVAAYCGVSHRTAQTFLANGLPAKRMTARLLLVKPADVDAFIERQAEERASQRGEEATA